VVTLGVPQIHDYNPGIAANGLFWTIRIPDSAVSVNGRATSASYALTNVSLFDYPDVEVALAGGPAGSATASFDVRWAATGKPFKAQDTTQKFVGTYRLAKSTIEWHATGSGFAFVSDPASTSTNIYSAIGRERNGIFYS
jgi:hypothetical protein